ncbi:MAG: peptidase, partial [Microcystaceae cyanobacterium]
MSRRRLSIKSLYKRPLLIVSITFLLILNLSITLAEEPPLPPLQTYPLPQLLQEWDDPNQSGDYFD